MIFEEKSPNIAHVEEGYIMHKMYLDDDVKKLLERLIVALERGSDCGK